MTPAIPTGGWDEERTGEPGARPGALARAGGSLMRGAAAFLTFVSTYFFTYWMGSALVFGADFPPEVPHYGSLLLGVAAGAAAWRLLGRAPGGLLRSVALGALITGAVGFAGGFFGPLLLTPGSNQGPLLGLLFTGPAGFVLGAVGGAAVWLLRRRRAG